MDVMLVLCHDWTYDSRAHHWSKLQSWMLCLNWAASALQIVFVGLSVEFLCYGFQCSLIHFYQ